MKYFDETEKLKKEAHLRRHPVWAQRMFGRIRTVHDVYDDLFREHVSSDNVLLDAGCGKKGIMNRYKGQMAKAFGIDLSLESIKENHSLDAYAISDLSSLPFKDSCFDIIVSQWAIEHVKDPVGGLREFYRTLKPGGAAIVVTNSIFNPIMALSAIFSENFRDRMKKKLLPPEIDEPTFPTYYKCNTKKDMSEALAGAGFKECNVSYVSDASFFVFSRFLFPLGLIYEKATDIPFLRMCKMHVMGHAVK